MAIRSSAVASVAVVGGTGIKGMNAANANQCAAVAGFPDFMIFNLICCSRAPEA